MYEYLATVVNVVDGDTVDLTVDCGFSIYLRNRFRLAGIAAPEVRVANPAGGRSKAELARLLPVGSKVTVLTVKDRKEKYGRYLAVVLNESGVDVCRAMVDGGFAQAWDGVGKQPT